jgi:virginiamycin B lyase
MKHRNRLVAFVIVLTALAYRAATSTMPTVAVVGAAPQLAPVGPAGRFKSFRVPTAGSDPLKITLGSDGNMWFTESNSNVSQIGRIDAAGNITEFVVPTRFSDPSDIVSGPDGALWFTAQTGFPDFFIGRITTAGQFTGFAPACDPVQGCSIVPNGIASGPDGNLWFTENIRNAVVRLTPLGAFTFFTIPTAGANPQGITTGPDMALWFAEQNTNKIGRIDVAGNITEFGGLTGSPERITTGPDANLWFTEPFPFDNKIGRITTAGLVEEFQLASPSGPRDIVTGPDGNLWFTKFDADQLSLITTSGVVTDVQKVGKNSGPFGIGRAADGAIWITLMTGNKLGRFGLR